VLGAKRVERIRSLADELTGSEAKALAIATDVTDFDQIERLVDADVQPYGRIYVMINNDGLMPSSPGRLHQSSLSRVIGKSRTRLPVA
jgi:NADP-dependent 3-hydroxy acid dehydrogenase YdfG